MVPFFELPQGQFDHPRPEKSHSFFQLVVEEVQFSFSSVLDVDILVFLQFLAGLAFQLVEMLFLADDGVAGGNEGEFLVEGGDDSAEGELDIVIEGVLEVERLEGDPGGLILCIFVAIAAFGLVVVVVGEENFTLSLPLHEMESIGNYYK